MELSPEMRRLITRARERMAEQAAHDEQQRASGYTLDGRHAEFCGAYRELLDMLVCELERAAAPGERERYIVGPDGVSYGPFAVPSGTGWPVA